MEGIISDRLTVLIIPCDFVEAPRAMVTATRDEHRNPNSYAIGNVNGLNGCIVAQRCNTRSWISSVLPWFQKLVPKYTNPLLTFSQRRGLSINRLPLGGNAGFVIIVSALSVDIILYSDLSFF